MDVGGGTLLLTMADLSRVQARVRVDETDLGKIAPGMPAEIRVAAFPGKRFKGTIEKIEPQAIVEQNVTLFPVLISLDNDERLLRPGMNVDVEFEVARRDSALTIPVTALRTERDVETTASITGLDPAVIRRDLEKPIDGTDGSSESPARESAARLGDRFWVVVDRKGVLEPVPIVTGITDLDQVEVVAGLKQGESVLVLPSSSLVESQELLQNFVRSRGGIPGITQQQERAPGAPVTSGKPAPGPAPGSRPAG
jgi:HlyD family secretion protein